MWEGEGVTPGSKLYVREAKSTREARAAEATLSGALTQCRERSWF